MPPAKKTGLDHNIQKLLRLRAFKREEVKAVDCAVVSLHDGNVTNRPITPFGIAGYRAILVRDLNHIELLLSDRGHSDGDKPSN
jgi:hypothetical protein